MTLLRGASDWGYPGGYDRGRHVGGAFTRVAMGWTASQGEGLVAGGGGGVAEVVVAEVGVAGVTVHCSTSRTSDSSGPAVGAIAMATCG